MSFSFQKDRCLNIFLIKDLGGIGRATAQAFARTGKYDLALHYNSANFTTQQKLLHAINDAVTQIIDVGLFQADLSSYDEIRRLHKEVQEQFGGVDILFCNAGTTGGQTGVASLADVDIEVMEKTWRINTGGPMLLTQLCLPFMEEQQWGRLIMCSSVAAWTGGFVGPHYASSKSGLHGFVHWLGKNVAPKGITVNAVAPALIADTDMMAPQTGTEEQEKRVAQSMLMNPREEGEVLTLLHRSSCCTTGPTRGGCGDGTVVSQYCFCDEEDYWS